MSYIRPEGRSKQHLLRPETTLLVTRMFLAFHSEYVCLLFIPHNIHLVKLLDSRYLVFTSRVRHGQGMGILVVLFLGHLAFALIFHF